MKTKPLRARPQGKLTRTGYACHLGPLVFLGATRQEAQAKAIDFLTNTRG